MKASEGQGGMATRLWSSRWLVLVASMWLQACAGVGYVYGSYSPLIKSSLHLNQKQMNTLGVAKDMGDSVGLFAGALSDVVPPWALILLGALQNLVGYGGIWFAVTSKPSPFWLMCILIFIGTNGETYFNTVALVSCVRNFPRSRGPIVGILKGFTGLCGAIFTLMYAAIFAPDQAAFIIIVAAGPLLVGFIVMGIIRPISQQEQPLEGLRDETEKLGFIYNLCLVIAAYLLVVLLVQDLADVGKVMTMCFAAVLIAFLLLPLVIPARDVFVEAAPPPPPIASSAAAAADGSSITKPSLVEPLLNSKQLQQSSPSSSSSSIASSTTHHFDPYFSELEDERRKHVLPEPLLKKRLERMQSNLYKAVAEGAIKIKRPRKGPRRGEDFTLAQALVKADFMLMFLALFCGAGSGLTAIDNLGQMGQAQGYPNAHIFVSMMSIWNFLGRVGGGFVSEWAARDHVFPRPGMMGLAQLVMAVGHFFFAMAWPGSMYIGSLLVGLGYGAHWAIVPAMASELFGLKNFGSIYNFLAVANPLGSLLFSGVIAGSIYDHEAERQYGRHNDAFHSFFVNNGSSLPSNSLHCKGAACFRVTFLIMTGVCLLGSALTFVLVVRTRRVYAALYAKQPQQQEHSDSKHEGNV